MRIEVLGAASGTQRPVLFVNVGGGHAVWEIALIHIRGRRG